MLEGLSEEPTRSTSGVIDSLADFRVDGIHHCPDDFPRREELSTIVPLLAHLQKESFVDLGQGEYVGWINRLVTYLVNLIQDIEEIPLGVNAYPLDALYDFTDDFLTYSRIGPFAQTFQMGQ
jgi:hypothetical protein